MCRPYLRICYTKIHGSFLLGVYPSNGTAQRLRINLSFQSCASAVKSTTQTTSMHNRWPLIAIRFPSYIKKIYIRQKVVRNVCTGRTTYVLIPNMAYCFVK